MACVADTSNTELSKGKNYGERLIEAGLQLMRVFDSKRLPRNGRPLLKLLKLDCGMRVLSVGIDSADSAIHLDGK